MTQSIIFCTKNSINSAKLLEFLVDCKLNWPDHIDYLNEQLNSTVVRVTGLIKLTNSETAWQRYSCNSYNLVNYGISLWSFRSYKGT